MNQFDPNGAAAENSTIFGLPYTVDEAKIVVVPVPWDATASYKEGAASGISAIFDASMYVELYDKEIGEIYACGISYDDKRFTEIEKLNNKATHYSKPVIEANGYIQDNEKLLDFAQKVTTLSTKINTIVYEETKEILSLDKIPSILGGDHSVSYGAIQACKEVHPDIGILQIDAHCDLRKKFEGFQYSHGSIMHNALHELQLKQITQVGVRGFCKEEHDLIEQNNGIQTYFHSDINSQLCTGITWHSIAMEISATLPSAIYLSVDIDGLNPIYCPSTGTPVPGGLTYDQLLYLLKIVKASGKKIIGFDLVEVVDGKNGFDANVGAHLLYQLCGWAMQSNNK